MSFVPLTGFEGKQMELGATGSTTFTKGSLVKMSAGYLVAAAAGDNEVEYLALESLTSASDNGATKLKVLPIGDEMEFEALTGTTPVQATHVGNDYDLAAAASLDLTASTDKVFHIDSIVSAGSKLVRGRFNKPAIA